jgi:hypothetical protein
MIRPVLIETRRSAKLDPIPAFCRPAVQRVAPPPDYHPRRSNTTTRATRMFVPCCNRTQ